MNYLGPCVHHTAQAGLCHWSVKHVQVLPQATICGQTMVLFASRCIDVLCYPHPTPIPSSLPSCPIASACILFRHMRDSNCITQVAQIISHCNNTCACQTLLEPLLADCHMARLLAGTDEACLCGCVQDYVSQFACVSHTMALHVHIYYYVKNNTCFRVCTSWPDLHLILSSCSVCFQACACFVLLSPLAGHTVCSGRSRNLCITCNTICQEFC